MLLRSSSTPILGSLLASLPDTPSREFESSSNNNKHHSSSSSNSDHLLKKIPFLQGGYPSFSSFSCHSSPTTPNVGGYIDLDQQFSKKSLGGFRRAQSDGNLKDLAADMDELHCSKPPVSRSSRRSHHSTLQTIPSFSIYNWTNEYGEEEEGKEEEEDVWGGELSEKEGFLKRSITIGDNINGVASGDFSFGKAMDLIQEEEGMTVNGLHSFSIDDEEGVPQSPPMYLARGLGLDGGFGGGEDGGSGGAFRMTEYGGEDHGKSSMEEYYKKMVEENPGNPLFLRNYAQFLYQSKRDLPRAEEYYSRALLSEPGDGDMLSQYAKIVWELHGDHERASSYFERAVQVAPDDSYVHAAYASFLWETEDDEEECSLHQDFAGISYFQTRAMTSATA